LKCAIDLHSLRRLRSKLTRARQPNTYSNVWDALCDSKEEAEEMTDRSKLMMALERQIRLWDSTQEDAANRIGITELRLNDLLKGKIEKFSLEALVKIARRAGIKVSIVVTDAPIAA
jgi:predicted XRE-type DNA-binding protein